MQAIDNYLLLYYICNMTIEQTVTIPLDHRVSLEFLAPQEIPAGPARIELKVTPFIEKQDKPVRQNDQDQVTPLTDSLSGILAHLGDLSIEEIREERLAKYLE